MSDEDDYGDGEYSPSSSSHEVGFFDETEGALVAGRQMSTSGIKRSDLGKLKLALEAFGKEKGIELTLVPSGDLTDTGPGADDECYGSAIVGILHGSGGGYGPTAVTREKCLDKIEKAKAFGDDTWKAIAALLPESSREAFLENEIAMHVVPVGPLAYAMIVFGTEGSEEDAGEGEFTAGQDMSQDRHESGVWGKTVCFGEDPEVIDFSETAHQARVAAFPSGSYFVIARYD